MRARTQGRELALQLLYQVDVLGSMAPAEREQFLAGYAEAPEVAAFARELSDGVLAKRDEIDRAITTVAHNWELKRMAVIDRNVLRLGAYELLHRADIPRTVAINEAVELAKKYSTASSGAFVNGILDQITERRPEDRQERRPTDADRASG